MQISTLPREASRLPWPGAEPKANAPRLAIGYQLREYRSQAQLTVAELAEHIAEPASAITAWELGQGKPTVVQCCQIMVACTVSVPEQKRMYALLAHADDLWWTSNDPVSLELGLAACTQSAKRITSWYPHAMPSLAAAETPSNFLIGEQVLRTYGLGSQTAESWHLARLLKLPDNITVHVIPHAKKFHGGLFGEFTIFDLADDTQVVLVSELHAHTFVSSPRDVAVYQAESRRMTQELALSDADTRALLHSIIGA